MARWRTHTSLLRVGFWLALLVGIALPSLASAQSSLEILDIDTKEAPHVQIYFSARQSDQKPITGLKTENITLLIDGEEPPIAEKSLDEFKKGDRPVAVVVVFPIAKDYIEEFFGIRTNVAGFLRQFRDVDWVGAVAYDTTAQVVGPGMVTGADRMAVVDTIQSLNNSEAIEPNLFGALPPAINLLKNLEGVDQKYIILVTNAEGAVVGDDKEALKRIQAFQQAVKETGVRPLVVGYTPDGPESLTYRRWLQQLSIGGGTYQEATAIDELPLQLNIVLDQIFKQYILDVVIDLEGDYWLEEGKYPFTVTAKLGSQELKATDKAAWPAIEKDRSWIIWLIVSILGGLVMLILLIVIIKKARNRKRVRVEEEMAVVMVEQQKQEQDYTCEVCNKVIPKQLYGFRYEFCMTGGLPDCPYYQMPDQGKLIVNKGPLADVTFFIKEEITTVGSTIENAVALVDNSVSKRHAAIKMDDANRYELRDFGSTNGTYVNDNQVQRVFLKDGDEIRFGTVEISFKLK